MVSVGALFTNERAVLAQIQSLTSIYAALAARQAKEAAARLGVLSRLARLEDSSAFDRQQRGRIKGLQLSCRKGQGSARSRTGQDERGRRFEAAAVDRIPYLVVSH